MFEPLSAPFPWDAAKVT